ncbi:MAG: hypothetical protein H8E91_05225 [Planctomycetes bacterium]|nr:hypothetical protein [Planctomycetota bacterium]
MDLRQVRINQKIGFSPKGIAFAIFGMVILIPVLLLLLVAGLVAMVAYFILSIVSRVWSAVSGFSGSDSEGRKNVKIRKPPQNRL